MTPLLFALLINASAGPQLHGAVFTFDDGPSTKYTPKILKVLKKHKVRAVFCIPAVELFNKRKLKIAKQIVKYGHTICNHSYNHPNFAKLSSKKQWRQIRISQKIIKKKLGIVPLLFRPPFGVVTKDMYVALRYHKLKLFMWDIDTKDWSTRTTAVGIYNKVIRKWKYRRKLKKVSIILFHDTNGKTPRILERIILRIKRGP